MAQQGLYLPPTPFDHYQIKICKSFVSQPQYNIDAQCTDSPGDQQHVIGRDSCVEGLTMIVSLNQNDRLLGLVLTLLFSIVCYKVLL